ncbi:TetR/AcrR family transcriptional regulator [Mycobacterium sp. UM_CSW]|uniref:TetR/AcrR family transcriptional regulator n=1 Tax=Mycobacterium sp. UM_CSW TaxID=1370119 RepID=UPI0004191F88|nr:TetR/AcrR family transcriptional regulator [Mycobacterium sp. UM_CSW]
MMVSPAARTADALDSGRGERTRALILEASRKLFFERGYAGTPINAITEACGISRAGFYTYFKDKRDVFNVLGETVYHEVLAVIAKWAAFPEPYGLAEVRGWVEEYFEHLDRHGAFVISAHHSAPDDADFRRSRDHIVTRCCWKLGEAITGDGRHPPEAVGSAVMGLLERSWYAVQTQSVRVDRDEVIAVVAEMIFAMTRPR